jgi:U11/U12 small nuclear ribonucleoprotein 31 kDa protein
VVDTRGDDEKAVGKDVGRAKAGRKEKKKGYFSDESGEDDD